MDISPNRFISQTANGHPLTVYGTGGQSRAFIHIRDTARCVQLAIEAPPDGRKVRIFNQVAEARSVRELAEILRDSYEADISFVDNPRKELPENDLDVDNTGLRSLGFEPITLTTGLVEEVRLIAERKAANFNTDNVLNSPTW